MATEYRVNGATLEVDGATPSQVVDEMVRQGWSIDGLDIDGSRIRPEELTAEITSSNRVEIWADPPEESGASPRPQELLDQLVATLPAFRTEAEEIGLAFAKGEWRASLQRLSRYLGEVEVVESGFRSVADLDPKIGPQLDRLPELLRTLSGSIRDQSWVEVSDVLLYELAPYFDEWGADRQ